MIITNDISYMKKDANKLKLFQQMITQKKKESFILSSSRNKQDSPSSYILGLNSNNKQTKKSSKLNLNKSKDSQNLQSSRLSKLSSKSTHIESNKFHIKLPHGFYNDQKTSYYLNQSKSLSQKSVCYQVRPLSITQRSKLKSSKLQSIVRRRKTEIQKDQNLESQLQKNSSVLSSFNRKRSQSSTYLKFLPISRHHQKSHRPLSESIRSKSTHNGLTQKKIIAVDKFKTHTFEKYNKLVYGSKLRQIETKLLNKDISRICSQRLIKKKWYPPFQSANTLRQKFQGKHIVSSSPLKKHQQSVISKSSNTELKVLNIDKMFRKKQGKLTNIVPFQVPKFSQVTALKNINLITKKKNQDKLHDIIDEFNALLRFSKLKKARNSSKILGVKGKNFTKNPTFQQLMGLKLKPKTNSYIQQSQQIPPQVFLEYSTTYKTVIKHDFQLSNNFISGILQRSRSFNLQVLTRFYKLFVNKIAGIQEKIKFFIYFFIPSQKEYIIKSQLIQLLSILSKEKNIPSINLNVKTHTLSDSEKSNIFLQALMRVMFGNIGQTQKIDRVRLYNIFKQNDQAIDLLMKLVGKQE